ncbi:MAG: PP2C family protein-serine/threonine phosphatase, partial [Opitutaceae bacterium]
GEGVQRQELYQRIGYAALQCTGAISACIYEVLPGGRLRGAAVEGLFPPQRPVPEASRGKLATRARYVEQILRSETLEPGEGVIGAVAASRKGELVADGRADPRIVDHGDEVLAVRSLIAMPIEFHGELLAVLVVANPSDGEAFTPTDFSLVQSLAEQAGLALHNNEFLTLQTEKRQMDVDLALAKEIQQVLVPQRLPRVEGLEIDVRYIPAKEVGGDLVDVIALADGRVAVVVADVSGKSVGASILMAICRTRIRNSLTRSDSPAAVLREVNRGMADEFRPGMFVTALVAVLDGRSGAVTLARAGHEAPLVAKRAAGRAVVSCAFPEIEGMALGIGEPEMFDDAIADHTFTLEAGEMLALYTDGVTEAANEEGKEFSSARLADAVRTLSARRVSDLCDGILETVHRFTGTARYGDDLSFVLVKRAETTGIFPA